MFHIKGDYENTLKIYIIEICIVTLILCSNTNDHFLSIMLVNFFVNINNAKIIMIYPSFI